MAVAERLRAASDGIHLVVDQLRILENQKRGTAPSDPRFVELAGLVRATADELFALARSEESFARELSRNVLTQSLASIDEVAPRHDLRQILEEWRAVERQLAKLDAGSPEATALVARFNALRLEYAEAVQSRGTENGEEA